MAKFIFNNTQSEKVYNGASYPAGEYTEIQSTLEPKTKENILVLQDIVNGDINISRDGIAIIEDVNEQINYLKDLTPYINTKEEAISSNVLAGEDKVLYAKIHGQKANVSAGQSHNFDFTIPYNEIYFFGAEVMQDIIGVADYTVEHPMYGELEKYGYAVNLGTIKYKRETKFGARLPQGLVMRCRYTNDTDQAQEVGVNFLMHEIRDM